MRFEKTWSIAVMQRHKMAVSDGKGFITEGSLTRLYERTREKAEMQGQIYRPVRQTGANPGKFVKRGQP